MKNKKRAKKKKAHKIKASFTGGRLTNYSGIWPIFKFMQRLKVIEHLEHSIHLPVGDNALYATGQILNSIVLGVLSGLNRICKIESFTHDPLIQYLLNLPKQLDEDTLSNRLKRFTFKTSSQFCEVISRVSGKVHRKLHIRSDILDIDSSVRTVYGHQEGASKGFNSSHRGRKSYHPLLAFLGSTRECVLSWLRPGNAYTANNAAEFLKQALSSLPKHLSSLTVRGDSGFFDGKVLSVIESFGHRYLIKVNLRNLKNLLSRQKWQDIVGIPGWFMCEFEYQAQGWERSRRMVAIKKITNIITEDVLFPLVEYQYFCYVTNIEESPLFLHKFYGDRGESENWIEAIKNQLFAGAMLTSDFWANEALWQCSVLAYNISLWMRILTDKAAWRQEPNTFRLWFIQLAGRVVSSGRQVYLKLYKAYHYKSKWLNIDKAIDALQFA